MPIYDIDGERPDLPGEGRFWIADSAIVIGRSSSVRTTRPILRQAAKFGHVNHTKSK